MLSPAPTPGSWFDLLGSQTARRSSDAQPLKASRNLSTTSPQTTPPTENLQSEISTAVLADGQRFTLSFGGGGSLQLSTASILPAHGRVPQPRGSPRPR
jgi:hypothetical protein